MVAYIDPSVMTYTIQAVAGIAIAIGAAVGTTTFMAPLADFDELVSWL